MIQMYEELNLLGKADYKFRHLSNKKTANRMLAYMQAVNRNMKAMHPKELPSVEDALFAKYVHGSNAIEGNSLTLSEVNDVLFSTKKTVNKSINELLQTRNQFKVRELILRWEGDFNQSLIKEIHKRMMDDVDGYGVQDPSGEYRKNMVKIEGGFTSPSKPENIEPDLVRALNEYHAYMKDNFHPIECAAIFHYEFERIHPFRDGNGRTGRAILDFLLLRAGLPSIYIPPSEKEEYLVALRECRFGSFEPLVAFLIERVQATIAFFTAKTSMYPMALSDEMKEFFEKHFGKETTEYMIDVTKKMHDSPEDP